MPKSIRDRIIEFLVDVGLHVEERELLIPTFLPGISVNAGALVFDPKKLVYPGDLLHEAGHLAVTPKSDRCLLAGDVGADGGLEMGAIAWSYAAIVHLGLPAEVLFHSGGYKGGAASLCESFRTGRYVGVPILVWRGMTDDDQTGASEGATHYPAMKKWLCD